MSVLLFEVERTLWFRSEFEFVTATTFGSVIDWIFCLAFAAISDNAFSRRCSRRSSSLVSNVSNSSYLRSNLSSISFSVSLPVIGDECNLTTGFGFNCPPPLLIDDVDFFFDVEPFASFADDVVDRFIRLLSLGEWLLCFELLNALSFDGDFDLFLELECRFDAPPPPPPPLLPF